MPAHKYNQPQNPFTSRIPTHLRLLRLLRCKRLSKNNIRLKAIRGVKTGLFSVSGTSLIHSDKAWLSSSSLVHSTLNLLITTSFALRESRNHIMTRSQNTHYSGTYIFYHKFHVNLACKKMRS